MFSFATPSTTRRLRFSTILWMGVLLTWVAAGCAPKATSRTARPTGCPAACSQCDSSGVCNDCVANTVACMGTTSVVNCNSDGTFGDVVKTCDSSNNENCSVTGTTADCLSACDVAAASNSYIGCDYWPVTLLNSQLNPYFDYAVAVANPLSIGDVTMSPPAVVTITRGSQTIASTTINAGDVVPIILPWVKAISQNPDCPGGTCGLVDEVNANEPDGAYHLVSNLPVSVYQFNPLQFQKPNSDTCNDGTGTANCHSYTNDASLLLPTPVLRNEYIVASRQSFTVDQQGQQAGAALPGYFTVVGTVDNTTVTINFTAYTEPGANFPSQSPGSTGTYMVNKGQVLQLISKRSGGKCVNTSSDTDFSYCDYGPTYDLTGTHITADQPIEVFGGHSCSFVPYNKFACDHLETAIFPLETWGQHIIVAQTFPQAKGEPNIWRVVSGTDGNMLTFDPPTVHAPITLDSTKWIEFTATDGFQVTGTGRVMVAQYMVGQYFLGATSAPTVGDPSLGLGIPVEQYRNSYDFLIPDTYTKSYVNIIAQTGTSDLQLDSNPLAGTFTAIGGSGYGFYQMPAMPGAHHMSASMGFGITVSGVASFTSYLYAGGLNLNSVVIVN